MAQAGDEDEEDQNEKKYAKAGRSDTEMDYTYNSAYPDVHSRKLCVLWLAGMAVHVRCGGEDKQITAEAVRRGAAGG